MRRTIVARVLRTYSALAFVGLAALTTIALLSPGGDTAIRILSAAALIAILIGLFLYRTLRWIVEPIRTIEAAAGRYATGELSVHLRTNGPRELRSLAEHLNRMTSELRRQIEAISEQRNQLEVILASMVEAVIVLDERRRILRMNEAAGRLLGVGFAEAQGRTLIEYLRNARLDELAERAFSSDQPNEQTITVYRERPLHLQVHATALRGDGAGRPTGSLLVMSDITRLKHLEELRKDFVANVSHELKTPITSIKGFVETLLDDDDLDTGDRVRFLNIILNHSNRLNSIIEDLLSLSRLEQGDEQVAFSRFPVRPFVSAAVDLSRQTAEEKQIPIDVQIDGEPTAWGNANLLEQALVNLLDNAIKYSPYGGRVELIAESEPDALSLRVIDHGPGIRPQDLPRIFERFYRTDAARSREHGGTGLGLAIVKHIARTHGGEVSVQSIVGQGSTFSLEIPGMASEDARSQPGLR
ncbi:MAG: sensor histidine kinase [Spirochaetota bacterium]